MKNNRVFSVVVTALVVGFLAVNSAHAAWTVTQLTDNSYADYNAQIDGPNVIWYGYGPDGSDSEIFLATPALPGDATCDNSVNSDDLVRILTNWGASGPAVSWEMGDVSPNTDGDNFIGVDDYVEVLTYWGSGTPPEPVPEPAVVALVLFGGFAICFRRAA